MADRAGVGANADIHMRPLFFPFWLMSDVFTDRNWPEARDALLENELALRRQMEAVAAELRALPPGGEVPEDYTFDEVGSDGELVVVRLSELFRGHDTLMVYHY